MEGFYHRIKRVGEGIRELCERLMLFEMDHPIFIHEVDYLTKNDAVMDLSYILYQYFVLNKEGIIENMNHILDSQMITDDSDMNDVVIYHHAFLFLELNSNTSLYQGLIEEMVYLGGFYEEYDQHKKEFEEFELMNSFGGMNIK
jgi:hypothetical protein